MISSIQESYIKQIQEQGKSIRSSENRYYLEYLKWKDTVENDLFWRILHYSYAIYGVYDYETLIKLYIRFDSVPNKIIDIYYIYREYFNKKKGTLSDEGFEKLIKQIEKC